ncbi:MAG: HEPN domain-containing protein [Dehalococcoidia bacterium]|nr:HEPN domain-containing protein [Dehalococcoidia bacterium]
MRRETERWLQYARDDLDTARVTYDGERWTATSFHAQQAAEKALKALWFERRGGEPPRTHDLVRLAQDVGYPDEHAGELDAMTQSYVVSRYPDAIDDGSARIDKDTAEDHRALAESVIRWVREQLKTESSTD